MKKSLVALAVLGAFTGIASAQSSVTLYGRIDQNVTFQDPGKSAPGSTGAKAGKSVVKLNDGGVNGFGSSRFGLRGTEDLGDGLKAYFVLESQIKADTGEGGGATQTASSSFFNRQSYVALGSSSLGDVRFGRLESITREYDVRILDASGENELGIAESISTSPTSTRPLFQNFGTRIDNAFSYRSPILSGFQGILTVGLSEDFKGTGTKAAEYEGVGLTFTQGPFNAALSYEQLSGGVASGSYNKVVTVGANYDFGIATVFGAYQNTSDFGSQVATIATFAKGTDHDAYNLGVKVPYGNFTFKAQYTSSTIDPKVGSNIDQDKYGASVAYALSKRTTVYLVATQRGGDDKDTFVRRREVAVGIGHNF